MPTTAVQIRWMIRRDMAEVLQIEQQCFDDWWNEEDFTSLLRTRNCIGMIAEFNERIVGFMVYELLKSQLHVLNFAVHPTYWRGRVGTQMAEKLKNKLAQQRRETILVEVRDGNLLGQVFWKSQGFRAVGVLRQHYRNDDDAYQFRYTIKSEKSRPVVSTNRISGFFEESE